MYTILFMIGSDNNIIEKLYFVTNFLMNNLKKFRNNHNNKLNVKCIKSAKI